MLTTYLNRTKFIFVMFMMVWVMLVVLAIRKSALETQVSYISRQANYVRYKMEFDNYQKNIEKTGLASVGSLLLSTISRPSAPNSTADTANPTQGVPVLLYHGIVSNADRFSLTPELFKDQMFALKRAGYETVKIDDFIAFMKGERELPDKSFLLTFDDGRTDSYQGADPILKALGWSAVMFVATDQSFATEHHGYYINEGQAKDMIDSGRWEIESHAAQPTGGFVPINALADQGNFLSNRMWIGPQNRIETEDEYRARVNGEFSRSKGTIERLFGTTPRAFAYPFSDYGNQTINAADIAENTIRNGASRNYEAAFMQTWPTDDYFTFNYRDEDMYRLRRIETPSLWSGEQLLNALETAGPKKLPYVDTLRTNQGWKNTWGTLNFSENGLQLVSNTDSTGSFAFLDGSRTWRDYFYTVKSDHDTSSYISLYARYQSNDNYVSCTFGKSGVKIDEKVEGTLRTVAEAKNPLIPASGTTYGIRVSGGDVSCYENGQSVTETSGINTKIASGGIGLRIWNDTPGGAVTTLSDLRVDPVEENR